MQTMRMTSAAPLRKSLDLRGIIPLVWDWRLPLLLVLLALFVLLAAQVPLRKTIHLGSDDGPDRSNAFTFDFYPPEQQGDATFRWSTDHGRLVFPGVGAQPLGVQFDVLAHRAQFIDPDTPTPLRITINNETIDFSLRRERAQYHVLVPQSWVQNGTLDMIFATPSWQPAGDSRSSLGMAMGEVAITGFGAPGTRLPYWPVLGSWLLALLLCWPTGRMIGFSPNTTFWMLLALVLVPVCATAVAPAYLALGNRSLLIATAWSVLLALVASIGLPPLLRLLAIRPDPVLIRWLILVMAISFALKYGGRLYPGSMHGDLELHWHRFARTMGGSVYIMAAHRGLPFPFPGALYILIAPLIVFGIPPWVAFEWGMALLEATTPLVIALISARATGSLRLGVVGGAAYAVMAGGFMTTWFAFETHIFAQWATLLLWTIMLFCWPVSVARPANILPDTQSRFLASRTLLQSPLILSILLLVQSWVYLGHTGFLMNSVTLLGVALPLLVWTTWRTPQRISALYLAGIVVASGLVVAAIYYTAFLGLILTQLSGVANVGLLEVTGRRPVSAAETIRHFWEDGILIHYGFFPLPLALCGLALLALRKSANTRTQETQTRSRFTIHASAITPRIVLNWLIGLTFLVSLSQAILPLFTRSTLTTRYLMFAAWAIALASAPTILRLWRRGMAGKLVVILMTLFVAWGTLVLWAGALAFNIAPPEPF